MCVICVVSFKLKVISTIYIVSYEIGTSVIDHYNMTIVHENHAPFLFFLSTVLSEPGYNLFTIRH